MTYTQVYIHTFLSGWFTGFYFGTLCVKLFGGHRHLVWSSFRGTRVPGVVCIDGRILTNQVEPTWSEHRMHSVVNCQIVYLSSNSLSLL